MLAESYLTRTRLLLEDQSTTMRCGQKCGNWLKYPGQEIRTRKVHEIAALRYGPSRSRRGPGPLVTGTGIVRFYCGCEFGGILKILLSREVQLQLPV